VRECASIHAWGVRILQEESAVELAPREKEEIKLRLTAFAFSALRRNGVPAIIISVVILLFSL
jgi:hypothetical protein